MNIIVICGFGFSKKYLFLFLQQQKIKQKYPKFCFYFFDCHEILKYKKKIKTHSPSIIIGWSLGALLSLEIANKNKNIKGLFLMNMPFFRDQRQFKMNQKLIKVMIQKIKKGQKKEVLQQFYQNSFYPLTSILKPTLPTFTKNIFIKKISQSNATETIENINLIQQLNYLISSKKKLPKNIPMVLWHSGRDLIFPQNKNSFSQKNIYYRYLTQCGHALPFYRNLKGLFQKDFAIFSKKIKFNIRG